jgi:hypothetical protein
MNELEFKRHLKDLVRGHHHPEQHDWEPRPETGKTKSTAKRPTRKSPKKK